MIRVEHRRVILSVDQASTSGYCIHVGSSPVRHGVVTTAFARSQIVRLASAYAAEYATESGNTNAWHIFVFENHANIGRAQFGHGALIGQLHRWLEHHDLMGHPAHLRIGVPPNTWQRRVLGVKRAPREERKAQAVRWASHYVQRPITSDDEADAIGIGAYGVLDAVALLDARRWRSTTLKRLRKRKG